MAADLALDSPASSSPPAPRAAVVVPCYNDGSTLPETLTSLEQQEPCEVVIVDDGSDDAETRALLDDVAARGTRVVRQENSGPAAARMTGVHATSAPYVLPLDADDLLEPGAIALLADALDRDVDAALAWGDVEVFGDGVSMYWPSADVLDPWWITYVNELPVASMIRRSILLEAGGWQLRDGWEDWDLWMALAERGRRGVRVPRKVFRYRVHVPRSDAAQPASRRWADSVSRYEQFYADLERRHTSLFAGRRANWRRARAPWRLRAVVPVVDRLPLVSRQHKRTVYELVTRPARVLALRRQLRARR